MHKKIASIVMVATLTVSMLLTGCSQNKTTESTCTDVEVNEHVEERQDHYEGDKKPVIYLEGYNGEDVTLKLDLKGKVTMTYPKADSTNTWKFKALADGSLLFGTSEYRYIFWEGLHDTEYTFNKGFCVEGSNTVQWLEAKLTQFGLNEQEIEDFVTYWGPQMVDNKYNVISFQTTAYTDTAKLEVTPKPDKMIRVFMAWYPSDEKVELKPQEFKFPTRKGKVLIEWGGCKVDMNATTSDNTATTPSVNQGTQSTTSSTDSNKTNTDSKQNTQANQNTQTTTPTVTQPTQQPTQTVVTDPYAQYGAYAQCARDWDNTAAKRCGQTWAQLDAGTRSAAYNHWVGHGTSGW